MDDLVRERDPAILRKNLHEVLFDLNGIVIFGEIQALGNPLDVGIDDDARGDSEGRSQYDVGRFAGRSGDGEELLDGLRDLAVEAQEPTGQWTVISDVPDETQLPSLGGMRRAAIEEMKSAGIQYLLVDKGDFGATDFVTRQPQWGIRLLDDKDQARLYKLE